MLEIILLDDMTGRIAVKNHAGSMENQPGQWQLTVAGKTVASGKFFTGVIAAGSEKEFLLGVEVPPTAPGEEILLNISLGGEKTVFPLPVYMHKSAGAGKYLTGLRADAAQAMISGGKLSAVITANGMRELRYRGDMLIAAPPRLILWRHGMDHCERIAALELDRIRISADRFGNDGQVVECHALALPRRMDLDELEFTQRFEPLTAQAIRYECGFIVPGSFAGVPRLGVEFALPPELKFAGFCREKVMSHTAPSVPENMEFAVFRAEESGRGLLIAAAGERTSLQVLPYHEYELLDTAAPRQDGKCYVTLECRNSLESPFGAGDYRMALIFAPLDAGENAVEKARMLRMF